jgi:hypothetical protein
MVAIRQALLGLAFAAWCGVWAGGCGDDDSAAKKPTGSVGTAPKGTCKPGNAAECSDSDCTSGKPAMTTCGSDKTYGACKCAGKTSTSDGGVDGGADGGAGASAGGSTDAGPVWAMMGYDEKNNYFNPNEHTLSVDNAKDLVEKWRFEVQGYPPGTPVVAEGKVFVMATGGTYAIDLDTGKQVWANADLMGTASVAYADGFIYVHTAPAQLYKLAAKDGKIAWGPVQTYDQPSCDGTSSPILGGDKVFVGHSCGVVESTGSKDDLATSRGGVEAFDTASGKHVWTYWTVPDEKKGMEDGAMVWSTVAVDVEGGTVFGATGNSYSMKGENSDSIHAMGSDDGSKKWHTQVRPGDIWSVNAALTGPDTDFGANPILAEIDGKKVVADGDKGAAFWEFDRETGQILWSRTDLSASRDQAHGGMLMNGAFDGKYFYVVSNQPDGSPVPDGGVADGGKAGDAGKAGSGTLALLHALDPRNKGKDVWKPIEFQKFSWGAPSLANGLLVVPNDDDLYVFEAATGKQLIMFNTGGTIAAGAAAIVGGRIIVKSGLQYIFDTTTKDNNLVICYGLK